MKGSAACYDELRDYIETLWVIDSHDHSATAGPAYTDAMHLFATGYFAIDLHAASSDAEMAIIGDSRRSIDERWPTFERAWNRTKYTGYAEVVRRVIKKYYDVDEVTLDTMKLIQSKLMDLEDATLFDQILEEAKIVVRIVDVDITAQAVNDGSATLSPRALPVISLPPYHGITSYADVANIAEPVGRTITCIDEYLETCREIFETLKRFGAVAFKDQSAYIRTLDYRNPAKAEAESVFNWFMEDNRRIAAYPDQVKPLGDFLFHSIMRMARDMELPVQLHTGHMAGVRNEVSKANAIALNPLLELHREVNFDLFHANWPYSGELLYLGKVFPNVAINFCWAHAIDPIYCQNVLKQAIATVPHGKIHWYGSDFVGVPDRAFAHLSLAKDNLAIALSDLVSIDYLDLDDAKLISGQLLFDNPNEFYRLDRAYPSS